MAACWVEWSGDGMGGGYLEVVVDGPPGARVSVQCLDLEEAASGLGSLGGDTGG